MEDQIGIIIIIQLDKKELYMQKQSKNQSQIFTIDFLIVFACNITIRDGKGLIIMRETRILEFKETITNTFLKTVSAFSNYNGGTILFGVDDEQNI